MPLEKTPKVFTHVRAGMQIASNFREARYAFYSDTALYGFMEPQFA